jgi:hypothetical protein
MITHDNTSKNTDSNQQTERSFNINSSVFTEKTLEQSVVRNTELLMVVPWLKPLVAGLARRRHGFASRQHVDKAALGQVFSEYFGFPCQSFNQFLHHHNHLGLPQ